MRDSWQAFFRFFLHFFDASYWNRWRFNAFTQDVCTRYHAYHKASHALKFSQPCLAVNPRYHAFSPRKTALDSGAALRMLRRRGRSVNLKRRAPMARAVRFRAALRVLRHRGSKSQPKATNSGLAARGATTINRKAAQLEARGRGFRRLTGSARPFGRACGKLRIWNMKGMYTDRRARPTA